MNGPAPSLPDASRHDALPAAAVAAIAGHRALLLVDLDETLYLRSSTEDYLDCARPRRVAAVLLQTLEVLKPWRWTGGIPTRDVWRLRAVQLLLPWTGRRWRGLLQDHAARHGNQPLIAALESSRSETVITTLGFRDVVAPLVEALGFSSQRLIACSGRSFDDRRRGKLAMAVETLGADAVRRSLVLSDSLDDLPLLDACARPLRTRWPQARYRAAQAGVYLPGRYLNRVKHPGQRYVLRGILQEDFAFWLIASIALAATPLSHVLGLLLLLMSFWTIYEQGYVDNDRMAVRHEAEPKLSAEFHEAEVATPALEPWLWAVGFGAAALLLLRWPALPSPTDALLWATVLLATLGWFRLYNRQDKATRVWLFPGLQFARSAAFTVLVPVAPVAVLALGAHVLARWLPYYLYRYGGSGWPEVPLPLIRLLFFTVLVLLAITSGSSAMIDGTALALLAWNLYRARRELSAVIANAHRIDRRAP